MVCQYHFDVSKLGKIPMTRAHIHKPHHPNKDVPGEFEPDALPVEPDVGPVPALIPDDPEHERVIDPDADRARQSQRTRRQVEIASCP
jgi:hypothetical protein